MSGITICAQCGDGTAMPASTWLSIGPVEPTTFDRSTTVCCPRCAVLWLEATYRPDGLGVSL